MNKIFAPLISNDHLKKFLSFSVGSLGGVLFSYLATFFLNKTLSKEDMGSYSYVFNLLNLAYPVISLSVSSGYVRFLSIYKNELLINYVRKVSYISTMLFCCIIVLWFSNWYYLFFAFIILYQERLILARAKLEILKFNFLNLIQKILFLLFLYYLKDNLTGKTALFFLGMSYFISYLIVLMWKENKFSVVSQDNEVNKGVFLKFCTVTMLTMIVNWMLTVSDQIIIKYFYGYASLAPYSIAYRIVTMLSLVSGIFLAYYPTIYYKDISSKKYKEVFLLRRYFVLILTIVCICLLFLKDYVYIAFGASDYISENGYFPPLLLSEACRIVASVLMTFMTFKLRQSTILYSMLFVSILNIGLNVVFVPLWGPIAAAYSTLACFIIYLGLAFLISYVPEWKYIKSVLVCSTN